MTDGKKPDAPGAPPPPAAPRTVPGFNQLQHQKPGPPVPTPIQSPTVPAPANLKDTSPSFPSPALLKEARPPGPVPEFEADTVLSKKPAPTQFDVAKTQASLANPVLAKIQAEERAAAERASAERLSADRAAAEKAANERLVAERSGLRPAAPVPDRSLLATDPMRQAAPGAAAAAAKAQALRQQLASRPMAPAAPMPPKPDIVTEPIREAVARPPQPPGVSTVVQRPPAPLGQPKTDPMQQPDVLAAISRGQPTARVAIPPPPPAPARNPAAPSFGPRPIVPLGPPPEPTQLRPIGAPPPGPAPTERTEVRPLNAPPPGFASRPPGVPPPPSAERTEVRPLPAAPPPGVPMPPSAERTEVRPLPVAPPPGVPMPAAAERTEVRPLPGPPPAEPRTDLALKPFSDGPKITAPGVAARPVFPQVTSPREETPLPDLTPAPRPAVSAAPATPAKPAVVETPPAGAQQWSPPEHTAPAAPPNRPPLVMPPSFMDLPPAMDKPKRIDAGWLTTQPNLPGPFATQPNARPASVDTEPDPEKAFNQTAEEVPTDDVMASPAALWRRAIAWLLDSAVLGGLIGGVLFLASSALVSKPVPNGLHGLDAFLFRLAQIAIPALAVSVALALAYTVAGAVLLKGRTPGRLLTGIRLVDSTGQRPGGVRAVVRAVFALVSFALFLSGFWLALFDRRGQTLHDKLTRTFVIRPV